MAYGASYHTLIGLAVIWSLLLLLPAALLTYLCVRSRKQETLLLEPKVSSRFGQSGSGVRVLLVIQALTVGLTIAALAYDRWAYVDYHSSTSTSIYRYPSSSDDADPNPEPSPTPTPTGPDGDGDEIIVWECGLFGMYTPGEKAIARYTCPSPHTPASDLKCFDMIATGALVFVQCLLATIAGLVSLYNLAGPTCDGSIAAHQGLSKSAKFLWLTTIMQAILLVSSTLVWGIIASLLDSRRVMYTSYVLACCGTGVSLVLVVCVRRFIERLPPLVLPPKMTLRATRSMFEASVKNQIAPTQPTSRSGAPTVIPVIDGFSTLPKPPARSSLSIVSKPYRTSVSGAKGTNAPTVAFAVPSTTQVPRLSVPSSALGSPASSSSSSSSSVQGSIGARRSMDPPSPISNQDQNPSGGSSRKSNSSVSGKFSSPTPDHLQHDHQTPPTSSLDGSSEHSMVQDIVGGRSASASRIQPSSSSPLHHHARFCGKCGVGTTNAKASMCEACGFDQLV